MTTTPAFRETVVQMGPDKAHVGFLTRPPEAPADPAHERASRRAAIVILNAGIIHRVGANRMHVEAARLFARSGLAAVRFDLSGLGDTPPRREAASLIEGCMADCGEVLDWLEAEQGIDRVVLFGLCAGADHSVLYAGRDPRVAGVVLLDQNLPRTRQFHLNRAARRLSRLARKSPAEALKRIIAPLRAQTERASPAAGGGAPEGAGPSQTPADGEETIADIDAQLSDAEIRAQFLPAYQRMIAADQRILAIFTGGLEDQHNYREQLLDAYPEVAFADRLSLHYMAETDHSFTSEANRKAMFDVVLPWLETTLRAA